jgi:hypothetical protein
MKIYVIHHRESNYETELYNPIKNSDLYNNNQIIFPHDTKEQINSKEIIKNICDVLIAEVSKPATGMGIELGWADVYKKPIICIYRKGSKIANSLKYITDKFIEYENSDEMIEGIKKYL